MQTPMARAVILSLFLHIMLVLVFVLFGALGTKLPEKPPIQYVQIMTMPAPQPSHSSPVPEPKKEAPAAKPKPEPKPEPKPAPQFEELDELDMLAAEEEALESARAEERKQTEAAQQAREAKNAADNLASDSETAEYVDAIRSVIAQRWVRPPSARNGMLTVLKITLAPGGDVIDATVVQSSGDAALDRSAVNAVKNAKRLPVPEGALFQRFRELTFNFRPEDLRL